MHETYKHHDCKHSARPAPGGENAGGMTTDPVCGMKVDSHTSPHQFQLDGKAFSFCSAGCVAKFKAEPQRYLSDPASGPTTVDPSDVPAGTTQASAVPRSTAAAGRRMTSDAIFIS